MNLLDVLIVFGLIFAFVHGFSLGLVRQLSATLGFISGVFIGALVQNHIVHLAHTATSRAILSLTIIWSVAALFLTLGEWLGWLIKARITIKLINKIDRELGAVVSGVTLLLVVWLGAAGFMNLPLRGLNQQIKGSHIIAALNEHLPGTPGIINRISRLVEPNSFPQVFTGTEPAANTNVSLPPTGDLTAAVAADQASVVKIEGLGCGGIVEGSGFVAGSGLVATNAHVVAGVKKPAVLDGGGEHSAQVVWFDPNLDFAVLRVQGLSGKVLSIHQQVVPNATPGAVLGYPGGGSFTANPAAIIEEFEATGRNIYNEGNTIRNVYSVKADIEPGNSGGPLIAEDGSVIGLVFAQSTTYQHVGYALTIQAPAQELKQASASMQAVDTGTCAE